MQTLLTTTTEAAAADLQFEKRPDRAKFSPSTLVQTLVYGWLAQPTATVEQLAQMADRLGVDVSPQAIDQRFTDATADLLQQVLLASVQQVIAADPVTLPILQRFTSVRVHDSTSHPEGPRPPRCPDQHLARLWQCHRRWVLHSEVWGPARSAHRRAHRA